MSNLIDSDDISSRSYFNLDDWQQLVAELRSDPHYPRWLVETLPLLSRLVPLLPVPSPSQDDSRFDMPSLTTLRLLLLLREGEQLATLELDRPPQHTRVLVTARSLSVSDKTWPIVLGVNARVPSVSLMDE